MSIVVRRLNPTTVDIFTGNGWDNWSRFQKTDKGPKLIGGKPVTEDEYKEVKGILYASSKVQRSARH